MDFNFLNQLASEKYGLLGILLVASFGVIAFLFKMLMSEKDKQIVQAQETEAKVTLVLQVVNNTIKSILVYLEKDENK
jgi:hypothetical protein